MHIPLWYEPFVHKSSLTLQGSAAKLGYDWSKCLHASASDGRDGDPSSDLTVACHVMFLAVSFEAYNLCSRGVINKYLKNGLWGLLAVRTSLPDLLVYKTCSNPYQYCPSTTTCNHSSKHQFYQHVKSSLLSTSSCYSNRVVGCDCGIICSLWKIILDLDIHQTSNRC